MIKWSKIELPHICERLIAFSIPAEGEFLIVSYEGTHLVQLTPKVRVETDPNLPEYAAYDPDAAIARFRGHNYPMIGLHGGNPIIQNDKNEQLVLDASREQLSFLKNGSLVWKMGYKNFSGDWVMATFSKDDYHIVLGCPYGFDLVVLQREMA